MKKLVKLLAIPFALVMALGCFVACGGEPGESNDPNKKPSDDEGKKDPETPPVVEPVKTEFKTIHEGESLTVGKEASVLSLDVETEDSLNYIKIEYSATKAVYGSFTYLDGRKTKDVEVTDEWEDFYLPAGENQSFRQILDFYNRFNIKKLVSITFRAENEASTLNLSDISLAAHPMDLSKVDTVKSESAAEALELYLEGENLKLGCSLQSGGAINYLSVKGVKASKVNNNVYVGLNGESKEGFSGVLAEKDVNLINIADNGRLVQQSYYGVKYGQDGYDGTLYNGNQWPYNPVQGGSYTNGCSKVVDVQVSESEIYVKVRPLDWAKGFSVTRSYMENRYVVEKSEGGMEYIKTWNRFTDFSGYNHSNVRHQEVPAFYGIAPLNKAVYYGGSNPYNNGNLINSTTLSWWGEQTADNRLHSTECWISWVNEDDWGLGLYVPDIEWILAGRTKDFNTAFTTLGSDPSSAGATTYAAPLAKLTLVSGTSFEYSYYLTAGTVTQNRALFNGMHENGVKNQYFIDNSLPAWNL